MRTNIILDKSIVAILLLSMLFVLSNCSRDDEGSIKLRGGDAAGKPISFNVVGNVTDLQSKSSGGGSGSASASGSSNVATVLSSEQIGEVNGAPLYLTVTEQDNPVDVSQLSELSEFSELASKVTPTTSSNISGSFGLIAYTYATAGADPANWKLHSNSSVSKSGSVWTPTPYIVWPGKGEQIRFFAYHPRAAASSITPADGVAPKIENFKVNTAITTSSHMDLLIGSTSLSGTTTPVNELPDNPSGNYNVDVKFDHALCGITFKCVSDVTITRLKLSGVYDQGTLNLYRTVSWDESTFSWDESTFSKQGIGGVGQTYTLSSPSFTTVDGYKVLAANQTMMMIPQTCPEGAKLTITVNNVDYTIDLSGKVWSAGKLITYTIDHKYDSNYDYYFVVSDPTDLSYVGGTSTTGKITSYKTLKSGGTQEPLAVSIDGNYFYDTYEKAVAGLSADRTPIASGNFISSITPSVSGINTSLTIGYSGTTNQGTSTYSASDLNAKIANKTPIGTSSNYINLSNPNDLSTTVGSNTIVETANTYIVNGAGYYKIPLVMGNGIKNGKLNPTAYKQDGFVDYKGQSIESPYLHKSNSTTGATTKVGVPTSAYITWASKSFILANSSYKITTGGILKEGDVYWLRFRITNATEQAVGVVEIRDASGVVMWSYTIWLTDYVPANYPDYGSSEDPDVEVTGYSDASNPEGTPLKVTLMPRNLGWVETTTTGITSNYYEGQEAYVRVKQDETDDIKVVKIIRPRSATQSGARYGYSPYYQWGRKDALLPSDGTGNQTDLSAVGANPGLTSVANSAPLNNVIQNPHVFYRDNSTRNWTNSTNNGWWCAGNNQTDIDKAIVKTIYDPSPAGYVVPRYNAFNAFMLLPQGSSDKLANASSFAGGYYFYTGYRAASASTAGMGTIFFPAGGYRDRTMYNIGANGHYWYAVPRSASSGGCSFDFGTGGHADPYGGNPRGTGFGIRCQREESL